MKKRTVMILTFVLFGLTGTFSYAGEKEVAYDLATLFRSARGVISKNQSHINDPNVGDKGLSADKVIADAKANFKAATAKDLDESNSFVQAELTAIADVMNEAQDLINEEGKGFKGFLPAVFAAQVASRFSKNQKGKAKIKLTAPKKYVRNRKNRPDKWEHAVIEKTFKSSGHEKGKTVSEVTEVKGKKAFRFILPEYYKESCLKCHGGPKGELDITGGKKEGGTLGELGGAISVILYQ
ncbi:MAG: DUF3365 domain-containing protein [Nitrospiria bacterium]